MDANSAYIELTVTENLHPGRPADGIYQENCPTFTAIRAAVSDQCCRIETRVLEPRDATARAASHTAIVDKRSVGRRYTDEFREPTVCATDGATIVDKGSVIRGRIE